MKRLFRPGPPIVVTGLILILAAVAGGLLYHPTWLTGHYYEMRVTSISFDGRGFANITYDESLTYQTGALWRDTVDGRECFNSWSHLHMGFLRFPHRKEGNHPNMELITKEERMAGILDSVTIRQRLLIKTESYRIRGGGRLILARIPNGQGPPSELLVRLDWKT